MYFRYLPEPPPRNILQAEDRLQEALWEHWWGRGSEAKDLLAQVAEFCAERTLNGSYPKKPIQITAEESPPRSDPKESADVDC